MSTTNALGTPERKRAIEDYLDKVEVFAANPEGRQEDLYEIGRAHRAFSQAHMAVLHDNEHLLERWATTRRLLAGAHTRLSGPRAAFRCDDPQGVEYQDKLFPGLLRQPTPTGIYQNDSTAIGAKAPLLARSAAASAPSCNEVSRQHLAATWTEHVDEIRNEFALLAQNTLIMAAEDLENRIFSSGSFKKLEQDWKMRYTSDQVAEILRMIDTLAGDPSATQSDYCEQDAKSQAFKTEELDTTKDSLKAKLDNAAQECIAARNWLHYLEILMEHTKRALQDPEDRNSPLPEAALGMADSALDEVKIHMNEISVALLVTGIERESLDLKVKLAKTEIFEGRRTRRKIQSLLAETVAMAETAVAERDQLKEELASLRDELVRHQRKTSR